MISRDANSPVVGIGPSEFSQGGLFIQLWFYLSTLKVFDIVIWHRCPIEVVI